MSSIGSYQAITRYEDRPTRARDMDDIRRKQRESLRNSRLQLKCLKMLQYRRTLAMILSAPGHRDELASDEEYDSDGQFSQTPSNQLDDVWGLSSSISSPWDSPIGERGTPSPAPSMSSTSSHVSQDSSSDFQVPKFFLEVQAPSIKLQRRQMKLNGSRSKLYKQASTRSSFNNQPNTKRTLDEDKVKQDLEGLTQLLNSVRDLQLLAKIVSQHWRIMSDAFRVADKQVSVESLKLMIDLASKNLLDSSTILNMIQNGLMFDLLEQFSRLDDVGLELVTELLIQLTKANVPIIPYLIDTMHSCSFLKELNDSIYFRAAPEVRKVVEFYYLISEVLVNQLNQPIPPVFPDVLLQTGVSGATLQSFSPLSTFNKCFEPELISSLVGCLSKPNIHQSQLINMILVIVANSIRVAHFQLPTNGEKLASLLSSLSDSSFDEILSQLIEILTSELQKSTNDQIQSSLKTCTLISYYYKQYRAQFSLSS